MVTKVLQHGTQSITTEKANCISYKEEEEIEITCKYLNLNTHFQETKITGPCQDNMGGKYSLDNHVLNF